MPKNVLFLTAALVLSLCATVNAAVEPEPLFVANNPENMTFVDMGQVANFLKDHYNSRGITSPEDVDNFYEVVQSHGAPEAGHSEAKVALIVQDGEHSRNSSTTPRGVLVISGRYDKEKVLEMMRRQYDNHMVKTNHTPKFSETMKDGMEMHTFRLPDGSERKREMNIVSFGNYCLVSSSAEGDSDLLDETIETLKSGNFSPVTEGEGSVKYSFTITDQDRTLLNQVIDKKYTAYKKGELKLAKKRKGVVGWFQNRVGDHKVKFIKKSITELGDVDVEIQRSRSAEGGDVKIVKMSSTFENEKRARDVKRKLLRHLVKGIKGADNPKDKLSMSSNIKITCRGSKVFINSELNDAHEQMGCFALMSSYVARAILRN